METPNPILASPENGIIKSHKELLIDADKKIGELENKIRNMEGEMTGLKDVNEKLRWQNAQLRIGVTAMGNHFNCPPEEFKKIYEAYCAEQDKKYQTLADEAKKKFMDDMRAGKVPEVVDRATGDNATEFPSAKKEQ